MQRGLGEAARSWGSPPMSDCRGFPHSLLHQEHYQKNTFARGLYSAFHNYKVHRIFGVADSGYDSAPLAPQWVHLTFAIRQKF